MNSEDAIDTSWNTDRLAIEEYTVNEPISMRLVKTGARRNECGRPKEINSLENLMVL